MFRIRKKVPQPHQLLFIMPSAKNLISQRYLNFPCYTGNTALSAAQVTVFASVSFDRHYMATYTALRLLINEYLYSIFTVVYTTYS